MSATSVKQQVSCLVLGGLAGAAVIDLLAFTMAISAPAGFFDWFKANGALDVGLAAWHLLVAYSPGAGLPAFVALSAAFLVVRPTVASAVFFVAGLLLGLHVAYPLAYGHSPSMAFQRPWWAYGLELSLATAAAIAVFVARRRPAKPFGPVTLDTGA